jgi:hypothetical protein
MWGNSRYLTLAVAFLAILAMLAVPTAARTAITTIEPGDTVFVYETGLNVAALAPGGNLPTKFVKYSNDNPDHTVSGGGVEQAEDPLPQPPAEGQRVEGKELHAPRADLAA